ncbi:DUF2786 domain-containing protein [Burkholderia ambifaria]|uniref:DUF2786 domain-containing protein n=1 Tax=Burkholderia ambifaria TaxID=152480 RepID=UPI00158D7AD9|nr:DUF2786 domain-containing protein [Burkholderia ambifaria]
MERSKIIDKIRKCLRLAKSSNVHEAAAALRQAQKLMDAYRVDEQELLSADACEEFVPVGCLRPTVYQAALAGEVANGFACDTLYAVRQHGRRIKGGYVFVGCGTWPEIAAYTYAVLLRQLRNARAAYIQAVLRRCGTRAKTARADAFCEGWVLAVTDKIIAMRPDAHQSDAIAAFKASHYRIARFDARERGKSRLAGRDAYAGLVEGERVNLHHGVGAREVAQLGG